jgi:SAM-dependent methyltransferase
VEEPCPICDNPTTYALSLPFDSGTESVVEKHLCGQCGHFFHFLGLVKNENEATAHFNYNKGSSEKVRSQKGLLNMASQKTASGGSNILDFGVGRNKEAYLTLDSELSCTSFYGSDIVEMDAKNYFEAYSNPSVSGEIDAICSNNTIEHIDEPVRAWSYFNELLRPISEGGGIMLHSFPSQIHYRIDRWPCLGKGHCCIFTRRSLEHLCDRTGFRLRSISYRPFIEGLPGGGFPVFEFEKVSDL